MVVDRKEIERIIDDFDTKAEERHERAKEFFNKGEFDACTVIDKEAHSFEYCAAVVRQLIPHG